MTERLTDGAAGLLERRTSRRGVLSRAALAASALAVAGRNLILHDSIYPSRLILGARP